MSTFTIEMMNEAIRKVKESAPRLPDHIMVSRPHAAMLKAHIDFQGRDRRRIKREVNKAYRRARSLDIRDGISRFMSDNSFAWNVPALSFGQKMPRVWQPSYDGIAFWRGPGIIADTVSS